MARTKLPDGSYSAWHECAITGTLTQYTVVVIAGSKTYIEAHFNYYEKADQFLPINPTPLDKIFTSNAFIGILSGSMSKEWASIANDNKRKNMPIMSGCSVCDQGPCSNGDHGLCYNGDQGACTYCDQSICLVQDISDNQDNQDD